MADLPKCANPECPKSQTYIDREESGKFVTVCCKTCNGTQIITSDNYRQGMRRDLSRRGSEGRPQKYFHG